MEHDLLTVDEFARILRCDPTTIRRWIKQGVLKAVSLPHVNQRTSYRIPRATLDAVLANTATAASK